MKVAILAYLVDLLQRRSHFGEPQDGLAEPSTAPVPSGSSQPFTFPHPADRLPDFSFAGYRAGIAPLPHPAGIPVFAILRPSSNAAQDRTSEIQEALDAAGRKGGGAVVLEAGTYALSSSTPIEFQYDNVVLRGDPSTAPSPTRLICSGPPRHVFQVGSATARPLAKPQRGRSRIVDTYVPLGATSVTVEPGHTFQVGQTVSIQRKVTPEWLKALKMDQLVRGDPPKPQTWLKVSTTVEQQREISVIEDNILRWQVPLTDPIDSKYAGDTAQVIVLEPPRRVRQCAIESVSFEQHPSACSVPVSGSLLLPLVFGASEDCWARNVFVTGFVEAGKTMRTSRRITISDFTVHRNEPTANGGKGALPLDITIEGTQLLLLRGRTLGLQNTHSYVVATGSQAHGPNVVSGYEARGSTRHTIEPHQRWATGLLVEGSTAGQIKMGNR